MDIDIGAKKLVDCRICHDEDEDSNMEVPCSCSGTLKYAHRRCVQRWCNEKGDTICEICRQHFMPGYSAPSPLSRYGSLAINLRGSWQEVARNLPNTDFMGMVSSTDYFFWDSDFDDYSEYSSRRLICCRIVAIIVLSLYIFLYFLSIARDLKREIWIFCECSSQFFWCCAILYQSSLVALDSTHQHYSCCWH